MKRPAGRAPRLSMALACFLAVLAAWGAVGPALSHDIPVAEVFKAAGLDQADLARLKKGEVITRPIKVLGERDLGLLVASWDEVPVERMARYVEQGRWMDVDPAIKANAVISPDASLDDLKVVAYGPDEADEAEKLLRAEPGEEFNLSLKEIKTFQALPREYPDQAAMAEAVSRAYRQVVQARLRAYRSRGLDGSPAYARGDGESVNPGEELARATNNALLVERFYPRFHTLLLTYPENMLPGVAERFYLTRERFKGRPAFVLTHQLQSDMENGAVLAVRQFYVGHGYNSMQLVVGAFALDGGTLFMYRNHTYTDAVAGFASGMRHKLGQEKMAEEVVEEFKRIRADLRAHP